MRAPARTSSPYTPLSTIVSRICLLPGVTVRSMSGCTFVSRSMAPTIARSAYDEFTELPTQTCDISVPSTSATGTTSPGEDGIAISGSSAPRSIGSSSS